MTVMLLASIAKIKSGSSFDRVMITAREVLKTITEFITLEWFMSVKKDLLSLEKKIEMEVWGEVKLLMGPSLTSS